MKCDGVGGSQTEYCTPFDCEHEHRLAEHEHETKKEPEQDDASSRSCGTGWHAGHRVIVVVDMHPVDRRRDNALGSSLGSRV
jgi:hypothetical protein